MAPSATAGQMPRRLIPLAHRAVMALALAGVVAAVGAQENLAPNPGFEAVGEDRLPTGWAVARKFTEGEAGVVTDVVHSGARAACVRATRYEPPDDAEGNGSLGLSSDWFDAPPPGTTIEVGGWIRAQDVVSPGSYYMLRYTVYFFDAAGVTKIRHHDIACTEGSFDWTRFRANLIVPPGAARMKLSCQLTACTGTAWFDDLSATVSFPALTIAGVLAELPPITEPPVTPRPWRAHYGERVPLGAMQVATVVGGPDGRLDRAVAEVLGRAGVAVAAGEAGGSSELTLGGPELAPDMAYTLAEVAMPDLGDEGYALQVSPEGGGAHIRIAANTDRGRYYGLQTLRQLISGKGADTTVPMARVVDRPTIPLRGMAMGVQWFGRQTEALDRLAELKCNFVTNQGTFMGGKFGGNSSTGTHWREPLTDAELQTMGDYLARCRERFIEPMISMSPRGEPPTAYSSDAEVDLVVDKLAALYALGFRDFGLNFDDLRNIGQDRVLAPGDLAVFGDDLGRAHLHFCGQIFERLRARCPEVAFWVLPWQYSGFVNLTEPGRRYLRTLAELPAEVGMIVCANDPENLAVFTELTGRRPLVWDNWFARWEAGGAPAFVAPLDRGPEMSAASIEGYIFLPMVPASEDAAGTSWLTGADYLWAPERYDAAAAFERAVQAAMGGEAGVGAFRELGALLSRLDASPPDAAGAPAAIAELRAILPRLQAALPTRTYTCVARHLEGRIRALEKLLAG